ncbi:hypothetical protein D3C76_1475070 [compost metagenome]
MPALSCTSSGSLSSLIRTGIRWARRTQLKVGSTLASNWVSGLALRSVMPRLMLCTVPDSGSPALISQTFTGAPTLMRGSLVSSK